MFIKHIKLLVPSVNLLSEARRFAWGRISGQHATIDLFQAMPDFKEEVGKKNIYIIAILQYDSSKYVYIYICHFCLIKFRNHNFPKNMKVGPGIGLKHTNPKWPPQRVVWRLMLEPTTIEERTTVRNHKLQPASNRIGSQVYSFCLSTSCTVPNYGNSMASE